MSARQDIIDEVRGRLSGILVADGFQTNAGQNVLVGMVPSFSPDDPTQAIALLIDKDEPSYQGEAVVIRVPLVVHACVRADVSDPCVAAEAVIADIKKAIETDHDLGKLALARGLERGVVSAAIREQGSEYVAGSVEYRITYREVWGNP